MANVTSPIGVSLPAIGVSFGTCAVALTTAVILPASGVSLLGIAVSLVSTNATVLPPGTGPIVAFNNATGSMYVVLFGGFA